MPDSIPPRPYEAARLEIVRLETTDTNPLANVLARICEIAAETLAVPRVGIWLFVNDATQLRAIDLWDRTTQRHTHGCTLSVADFPHYLAALKQRKALPIENTATDPRVAELRESYLQPLNILALLDAPILQDTALLGIICHEHVGSPREWTTEERDFAGSVADLISLKMQAAEMRELHHLLDHNRSPAEDQAKFVALSRMALGIVHDFRNLLTMVLGISELVSQRTDVPDDVRRQMLDVRLAAEQANELTRQLVQFAKGRQAAPRVFDVQECVRQTVQLASSALGATHRVELSSEPAGRVLMNPLDLERVLLNLIMNSRDAMPNGGRITVTLRSCNGGCEITVADHGLGLDPQVEPYVFEPYFTTKMQGSGLGLAVAKQIIEQAGGSIRLQSCPQAGTQVVIRLPTVTAASTPATAAS